MKKTKVLLWTDPAFARKIKKDAIDLGFPSAIAYTRELGKSERNLNEIWNENEKKKKKFSFQL